MPEGSAATQSRMAEMATNTMQHRAVRIAELDVATVVLNHYLGLSRRLDRVGDWFHDKKERVHDWLDKRRTPVIPLHEMVQVEIEEYTEHVG